MGQIGVPGDFNVLDKHFQFRTNETQKEKRASSQNEKKKPKRRPIIGKNRNQNVRQKAINAMVKILHVYDDLKGSGPTNYTVVLSGKKQLKSYVQ